MPTLQRVASFDIRSSLASRVSTLVQILNPKFPNLVVVPMGDGEELGGSTEKIIGQIAYLINVVIPEMANHAWLIQAAEKFTEVLTKLQEIGALDLQEAMLLQPHDSVQ